jgi:hypothetical protein
MHPQLVRLTGASATNAGTAGIPGSSLQHLPSSRAWVSVMRELELANAGQVVAARGEDNRDMSQPIAWHRLRNFAAHNGTYRDPEVGGGGG